MKKITKKILIITTIIGFITLIIGLINKIIYLFSSLESHLYNPNSYFYQWKFGKIHYTVTGSGKPIVLIHSLYNGASLHEWHRIVKSLSKKHTVYALDLIGYGKSEKPKFTYTAYLFVQLITEFITNVVDGTPDVITNGKSNSILTMIALQNPSLVDKLIFINPEDIYRLTKNPSKRDTFLKYLIETPILGTLIYNVISSKYFLNQIFGKKYLFGLNSEYTKLINGHYESSHLGEANNKFAYASNRYKYTNVNIFHGLEQLNHSIYIIQGSERNIDPTTVASHYKSVNAAIETSTINKTKEFPHIENPESTIELISIFLH